MARDMEKFRITLRWVVGIMAILLGIASVSFSADGITGGFELSSPYFYIALLFGLMISVSQFVFYESEVNKTMLLMGMLFYVYGIWTNYNGIADMVVKGPNSWILRLFLSFSLEVLPEPFLVFAITGNADATDFIVKVWDAIISTARQTIDMAADVLETVQYMIMRFRLSANPDPALMNQIRVREKQAADRKAEQRARQAQQQAQRAQQQAQRSTPRPQNRPAHNPNQPQFRPAPPQNRPAPEPQYQRQGQQIPQRVANPNQYLPGVVSGMFDDDDDVNA